MPWPQQLASGRPDAQAPPPPLGASSISHAALFESASSLWLVLGGGVRAFARRGRPVPLPQVGGVLLGGAGVLLTARDGIAGAAAGLKCRLPSSTPPPRPPARLLLGLRPPHS